MLAEAPEDEVLKLWQGLGYYSRALNAHATAKEISSKLKGVFPSDFVSLSNLKGIGKYTASAILSIAYNQPFSVVDGNVKRFISRLFGIRTPYYSLKGEKPYYDIMDSLLDKDQPGIFNQAVMEFGALLCTPKNPGCANCPFVDTCVAFKENKVFNYPVKIKTVSQQNLFYHYLFIYNIENSTFYLTKRNSKTIWKNMYELPLIEAPESLSLIKLQETQEWKQFMQNIKYAVSPEVNSYRHILSHRIIHARFYSLAASVISSVPDHFIAISSNEIEKYAVPRLIDRFLKEKNIG